MSAEEDPIPLDELLGCLVECCEKAARIARTFRAEEDLFGILVEEKSEIERNKKMFQDFKTLADVLVQETIKRDVGKKFPSLISKIQGEEQNSFQNTLGESIRVELTDSCDETTSLLNKVLNGKTYIAKSLASIVHSEESLSSAPAYSSSLAIPAKRIGIWIDPIDSTAEYIQAKENKVDEHNLVLCGLKCVCVLIGVYDLDTGTSFMGIINQPFYEENSSASKWSSKIYWGISYQSERATSYPADSAVADREKIVVTSMFEREQLQTIMRSRYKVVPAAGAGYKCLEVALRKADLYVLSLKNTHYWDTCGPHAILSALGGGIVSFRDTVNSTVPLDNSNILNCEIKYLEDSDNSLFRNTGGLIAYRDQNDLFEFLQLLRENSYQHEF